MVADSQYVEALEREVRERETYDVLQQLRAEAEMEVGRHPLVIIVRLDSILSDSTTTYQIKPRSINPSKQS
jgi:hypothetical protein